MDTTALQNETSAKIAKLNDAARLNASNYMVTSGIMSLDEHTISEVFVTVQNFKTFNEDNDPYGEHDFGTFTMNGDKIFWKIDYYDQNLEMWCDPLDPDCRRVITIMLAEDY